MIKWVSFQWITFLSTRMLFEHKGFWEIIRSIFFTKSCLKVSLNWMLVFLNSCGRIDANKCRCKSCLQSILQLYLANILFHFLWLVGWIVTLSSIAALIVGTKYRNIPQTVIKSHKNVEIGNFQDWGQILAFSTFNLEKLAKYKYKTNFHFVLAMIDTQNDSIQSLNFGKIGFNSIFDSILVSQNSIQTIIQFKNNCGDSIQ